MATSVMADPEQASGEATATLVAMADYMLGQSPQQIQKAVHCLLAALTLNPPSRVGARLQLRLGLILYYHSNNLLEARQHLEQAMLQAQYLAGYEEVRFEAASILTKIHLEQGSTHHAKTVLMSVLDSSSSHRFPYWNCRLLLQKADVHVCERDNKSVLSTLSQVAQLAGRNNAQYTQLLCLLCKGAHLLMYKEYHNAASVLSHCNELIDSYSGPKTTQLKAFYLTIQVTHLLSAGQIKSAKPHLKQVQHCVKLLNDEPDATASQDHGLTANSFEWLKKEQLFILVYLVSVMYSVLAGHTDKALSYSNKALNLIQQSGDSNQVLSVFQAHLLELVVVCQLVQGHYSIAADKLSEVIHVCHRHQHLTYSHRAVLHCLLGLYAFATNDLDRAGSQFHTALQHTNRKELRMFISLNLVIVYIKQLPQKERELSALMESLQSENGNDYSQSCKGMLMFIRGLHAYSQLKLHEAKRHLRDTLVVSNGNDLTKLTACSLVVLGQIFLSLGNTQETKDMATPAHQLATKISDRSLQAWACALLGELYHSTGDSANESSAQQNLSRVTRELAEECQRASQLPNHNLIQWTVGDWPITHHTTALDTLSTEDRDERTETIPERTANHERQRGTLERRPSVDRKSHNAVTMPTLSKHHGSDIETTPPMHRGPSDMMAQTKHYSEERMATPVAHHDERVTTPMAHHSERVATPTQSMHRDGHTIVQSRHQGAGDTYSGQQHQAASNDPSARHSPAISSPTLRAGHHIPPSSPQHISAGIQSAMGRVPSPHRMTSPPARSYSPHHGPPSLPASFSQQPLSHSTPHHHKHYQKSPQPGFASPLQSQSPSLTHSPHAEAVMASPEKPSPSSSHHHSPASQHSPAMSQLMHHQLHGHQEQQHHLHQQQLYQKRQQELLQQQMSMSPDRSQNPMYPPGQFTHSPQHLSFSPGHSMSAQQHLAHQQRLQQEAVRQQQERQQQLLQQQERQRQQERLQQERQRQQERLQQERQLAMQQQQERQRLALQQQQALQQQSLRQQQERQQAFQQHLLQQQLMQQQLMQQQAMRPGLQMMGSPHAAMMPGGHYSMQGQHELRPPSMVRLPPPHGAGNTPPHYNQYRHM